MHTARLIAIIILLCVISDNLKSLEVFIYTMLFVSCHDIIFIVGVMLDI